MISDYILNVLSDNVGRAEDIVSDAANLEQTPAVLGVSTVASEIVRSLQALIEQSRDRGNVSDAAMTVDWLADFINGTTTHAAAREKAIALLSRPS